MAKLLEIETRRNNNHHLNEEGKAFVDKCIYDSEPDLETLKDLKNRGIFSQYPAVENAASSYSQPTIGKTSNWFIYVVVLISLFIIWEVFSHTLLPKISPEPCDTYSYTINRQTTHYCIGEGPNPTFGK